MIGELVRSCCAAERTLLRVEDSVSLSHALRLEHPKPEQENEQLLVFLMLIGCLSITGRLDPAEDQRFCTARGDGLHPPLRNTTRNF